MIMISRFFLCAVAVLLIGITPSFAEGAQGYAVVNVDRVMMTSKAAKSIEKQLKSKSEEYSKEFSKHERELRQSQEKLIEENRALGQDASESKVKNFENKRKDFEKKMLETQQLFQKRRSSLSKAVNVANTKLQKEMFQTVADIAEEEQYRIVFDRKSVVIVEEALDITDRVIKDLDKTIPEIKLDIKK